VKAKSGAWFFEQAKTKGEARTLLGTSLIRASLKRRKTSPNNNVFGKYLNQCLINTHVCE
jgi:hypothetical protein